MRSRRTRTCPSGERAGGIEHLVAIGDATGPGAAADGVAAGRNERHRAGDPRTPRRCRTRPGRARQPLGARRGTGPGRRPTHVQHDPVGCHRSGGARAAVRSCSGAAGNHRRRGERGRDCSAITPGGPMGPAQVDQMVRTNFAGPAAALAVAADRLADQGAGAIVVLSSVAGVRPRRSNYVYGSSKAGLDAFARGIADAVHDDRASRVLVVRPGFVRSSMTEGLDPAPFSTDPSVVGAAVARASPQVAAAWSGFRRYWDRSSVLLRSLPQRIWRRIAGPRSAARRSAPGHSKLLLQPPGRSSASTWPSSQASSSAVVDRSASGSATSGLGSVLVRHLGAGQRGSLPFLLECEPLADGLAGELGSTGRLAPDPAQLEGAGDAHRRLRRTVREDDALGAELMAALAADVLTHGHRVLHTRERHRATPPARTHTVVGTPPGHLEPWSAARGTSECDAVRTPSGWAESGGPGRD